MTFYLLGVGFECQVFLVALHGLALGGVSGGLASLSLPASQMARSGESQEAPCCVPTPSKTETKSTLEVVEWGPRAVDTDVVPRTVLGTPG